MKASIQPHTDRFGRAVRKLRISITDRCNMRCVYCMPLDPVWRPREEVLDYEEFTHIARIFVKHFGIQKIRLTGGEPLLRKNLQVLVKELASLKSIGLSRLSLTTNGIGLKDLAGYLKEAGLDDVNVSMDSLDPGKFKEITGGDLRDVLRGIEEAQRIGLGLKINTVMIRGVNDDEIPSLIRWAYQMGISLRFIEFMPLDGRGYWKPELVVTEKEILKKIEEAYDITSIDEEASGPARYYVLNGSFRVGVISSVSNPFCNNCDRVRITADGQFLTCLFSLKGYNLKSLLRSGAGEEAIVSAVNAAILKKPEGFASLKKDFVKRDLSMHAIGG